MKRKTFLTQLFPAAVCVLLSLVVISCSNLFETKSFDDSNTSGTAYICVKSAGTTNSNRTIFPTADANKLTNLVLKGTKQGDSEIELASADTLEALSSQRIEIEAGNWDFTLTATLNGVAFSGTATAKPKAGKTINLRFQLEPDSTINKGGFSIKLMFEGDAEAVEGYIYTGNASSKTYYTPDRGVADSEGAAKQTLTIQQDSQNKKYVSLSSAAISDTTGFTEGDYKVCIIFKKNTVKLNEYETSVQIKKGYVSEAIAYVNLSETYSVTLHLNGGNLTSDITDISYYLSKNSSALPGPNKVRKSGFIFVGWYTNSGLTGAPVTTVPAGTIGNNEYWAKWEESSIPIIDLYVSSEANSSDPDVDGSQEHPFVSIVDAVEKIKTIADGTRDWVIGVDGILSSPQVLGDGSAISANSIMLVGVHGNVNSDGINAGWDGETVPPSEIGSALTINVNIPIKIQGLLIKGGYATNGGGIYLSKGYVTFESGMITTNKATTNGGGVFVCYDGFATFEMKDGSIAGNHAGTSGGGVYIYARGIMGAGTFAMSGGTVSGNTAAESGTGYGHGVYEMYPDSKNHVSPYFEMSGSAVVSSDNDVYLDVSDTLDGAVITVAGALTGEAPVATITGRANPFSAGFYNSIVLKAEGSGSVLRSYKKFAVTPDPDDGTPYYVDPDGRLTSTQPQSFELYVQQGASGSGTSASSPFGSIEEAANYIATNGNSGTVASIKIIGNLSGAQVLSGFNDSKAKQIVIEGANGVDATSGTPLDALTGGSGVEKTLTVNLEGVSVEITNLRISGATQTGLYVGDLNNAYTNVLLSEGTLITQNGTGSGDYNGGGVYIAESSYVETSDGCAITNNKAGANGGGVYSNGQFALFGGTVSNNQAVKGTGIYVDSSGSLGMKGSGSVSSGNDIYLVNPDVSTYGGIIILGTLTAQAPVAVITPHVYENGTQLLETYGMSGAPTPDISVESQKFAVAQPSGSSITWSINTNGMLSDGSTTVSFYVAQNGSSSAAGSRGDPFDSLYDALDYIADNNYSGYDVIVKVDGVLPVADHETQHTVYISSFSGNSLTIEGANGLENGIPQDSISGDLQIYFDNYALSEITFRNICLTGSSSGNYIGGGDGEIGYYRTNVIFDSGVLIKGNTAEYSDQGAAFSIKDYSSVTMKDGCVISGNHNTGSGSDGVYIASYGTFNMEGGTIKDNKESGDTSGTGVKVCGTFNISGGAVVASNNIVSLYSQYTNVTIADDLTADGIVATISPATSGETGMYVTPAVLLSEAKSGLISAYYNKFAVMPKSGMNWAVDDEGNLVPASSGGGTMIFYVAPGGTGDGSSETSAFGSISEAIEQMTDNYTDYIVNVCGDMSGDSEWDIEGMTGAKTITIQGNGGTNVGNKLPGVYTCSKAPVTFKDIQIGAMYIDAVQYDEDDYYHANVILDSGTLIKGNTGIDEIHGVGLYGVVHLYDKGAVTLTMKSGAEISNNTYVNSGLMQYGACGGVYIGQYSEFIMEGGTISGNAVYDVSNCSDGRFVVSGDAQAGDVYCKALNSANSRSAPIYIGGPLTSSTVANIKPYFYTGWQGIALATDEDDNEITTTTIVAEYTKFTVEPDNQNKNWIVNSTGYLEEQ